MYGIDLIIVSLWLLPVTLFIIIPLALTCLWSVVSLVVSPFRQKDGQPAVPLAVLESN